VVQAHRPPQTARATLPYFSGLPPRSNKSKNRLSELLGRTHGTMGRSPASILCSMPALGLLRVGLADVRGAPAWPCFFSLQTTSPRLCVAVGIPGGGLGAGISNGRGKVRGRVAGGPELSMLGQIPQPGWAADSVPRSLLSMGPRPGGRVRQVCESRLTEQREAGGGHRAELRGRIFCAPHPFSSIRISSLANLETRGTGTKPLERPAGPSGRIRGTGRRLRFLLCLRPFAFDLPPRGRARTSRAESVPSSIHTLRISSRADENLGQRNEIHPQFPGRPVSRQALRCLDP
jgi:hypothetical protein